jgi:hypothetical protein
LTEVGEIGADGVVLPGRPFPEVGEAAGGEVDGLFGGSVGGCADGCDPRAGCRELRGEVSRVLAVVGLAGCADAGVAGGEDYGDAATAELGEEVANALGVACGDAL